MSKNPKTIVVSYRLSPAVIAKAIDGLKAYDKTASIDTLASICKQAMLHGVNYLTHAMPFEPSQESQRMVKLLTTQGRKKKDTIEEQILQSDIVLPRARHEETVTGAEKSIVSDFSVGDDLREEE